MRSQTSRSPVAWTFAEATLVALRAHRKSLAMFDGRDPTAISFADVQTWVSALKLKPSSIRAYVTTFRRILDFAEVEPNVARDPRVKLPRHERVVVDPPSARDVEAIIEHAARKWRLPLRLLAETGMRVGETHQLTWGDVDENTCRFRIKGGKTVAARRWVAVPEELMTEISATCPREDRVPERRVFPGFSPSVARDAMSRACKTAGVRHFHPHGLRHRYISVQIANGVPVTTVAAAVGHTKKSVTLDVYSHVLVDDDDR